MKKTYTILFILNLLSLTIFAQSNFKLNPTSYVGALSNDANGDWTKFWTNYDPKSTNYPEVTDTLTLNGMLSSLAVPGELEITGTLNLDATKVYRLSGIIVVKAGGVLNIPAGTLIRAEADLSITPKNYATLVIERGGKLIISGHDTHPVVFTSNKPVGKRDRGNWGGILIAGKAYHNLLDGVNNNNVQMEGFNNVTFDPNLARFGGTDPNDNSGEISYLRIEFGGLAFEANKEINALTFGAVGNATKIGYVQVSFSGDDSYEWFGGSINTHHLIAFKGTDDDFDTDNGYSGISQFGIAIRDSSYFDLTYSATTGASTSESFESDNEATGTASVRPLTTGVFSNYTLVGPVPVGTTYAQLNSVSKSAFRRGARIRRNSGLRIVNSIFMGYRNFLMLDGDSTLRRTNDPTIIALLNPATGVNTSDQLSFANNLIVNTDAAYTSATDSSANGLVEVSKSTNSLNNFNRLTALTSWVKQAGPLANNINPVAFVPGTLLVNPMASSTSPDFKPVSGSPALQGANFTDNPVLKNLVSSTREINEVIKRNAVYPNPVINGVLFFKNKVAVASLFDLQANLVQHAFDTQSMQITQLPAGIYMLKIDGECHKINIH